jgi:hypothetical protein
MELPDGNYRFAVSASVLHKGYWSETYASDFSGMTEPVAVG